MYLYIAQVLRIISSFFTIKSDKASDKKSIYLYNSISNFLCGLQYLFLNAITGAISSFVAIFRNVIFYKYNKKIPLIVLILYIVGIVFVNSGSYSNYLSFIPVLLVIIYTVALYINKVKAIKYAVIITCMLEIYYDVYYKAYVGIIICLIDAILVIRSLIKDKEIIQKGDA